MTDVWLTETERVLASVEAVDGLSIHVSRSLDNLPVLSFNHGHHTVGLIPPEHTEHFRQYTAHYVRISASNAHGRGFLEMAAALEALAERLES